MDWSVIEVSVTLIVRIAYPVTFSMAVKLTEYSFSHFSEHKYGEWYGYLRRDGKVTEPPCKGHTYKGPFHVIRCLSTVTKYLKEMEE